MTTQTTEAHTVPVAKVIGLMGITPDAFMAHWIGQGDLAPGIDGPSLTPTRAAEITGAFEAGQRKHQAGQAAWREYHGRWAGEADAVFRTAFAAEHARITKGRRVLSPPQHHEAQAAGREAGDNARTQWVARHPEPSQQTFFASKQGKQYA